MIARKVTLICGLLSLCFAGISFAEDKSEEFVVQLTKSNFKEFIEKEPFTIVKFYAPWCGHCKRLAPEYEAAAKALHEDGVKLAKVDVTVEQDLGTEYEIKGFPTLKVFRNGVDEEYAGGRTSDTIISYVRRMTGPAVVETTSLDDSKAKSKGVPVSFIGSFHSKESNNYVIFKSIAESMRNAGKFFAFFNDKNDETVVAMRAEEGLTSPVKVTTNDALKEFIMTEKFPLFGAIDTSNYASYFSSGLDVIWFIGSKQDFDTAATAIRQVAAGFRNKALYVWLDSSVFKDHAYSALGVSSVPALVAQINESRYLYDEGDFESADKIKTFCTKAFDGTLEKHLMSEPIPESQPADDPVITVVGQSIEKIVFDDTKDVFLEIYAPWCGHCKQFEETYKNFAESMKKYPNVVVAKMDGTKNESPKPEIAWQGFPTIFFVKAGSNAPMMYDGPRTQKGLMDYLKQHGSQEIDETTEPTPIEEPTKDEL